MVKIQPISAAGYLFKGMNLMFKPGIRRYVFIPLIINILLFAFGFYYLFQQFDVMLQAIEHWLPEWLGWLIYLVWPIGVLTILIAFGLFFGLLANWLAAPFNGMLSAKVERMLTPHHLALPERTLAQEVTQAFKREWQKLKYWLPRACLCAILFIIPIGGQLVAPWIWMLFSAWMMTIQYCDYPYDNHQVTFKLMRKDLGRYRWRNLSFGGIIMLLSSVPILNLFVMPMAICASTAMWVDDQQYS